MAFDLGLCPRPPQALNGALDPVGTRRVAESCPLSPTLAGLIPQAIQWGERRDPFPAMGLQMEIAAIVPSIAREISC